MSGTSGLSYRLEAIQIKLTGADADDGSLKMTMDGKVLWIARTREI